MSAAIDIAPAVSVHTLPGLVFGHNPANVQLFDPFEFECWAHPPRVAMVDGIERDPITVGKRMAFFAGSHPGK